MVSGNNALRCEKSNGFAGILLFFLYPFNRFRCHSVKGKLVQWDSQKWNLHRNVAVDHGFTRLFAAPPFPGGMDVERCFYIVVCSDGAEDVGGA